jgi:hypothetical protein
MKKTHLFRRTIIASVAVSLDRDPASMQVWILCSNA